MDLEVQENTIKANDQRKRKKKKKQGTFKIAENLVKRKSVNSPLLPKM
jgi:hypothetical protein